MIQTLHFQSKGNRFNPWLTTKIPHVVCPALPKSSTVSFHYCLLFLVLRYFWDNCLNSVFSKMLLFSWQLTKTITFSIIWKVVFRSTDGWLQSSVQNSITVWPSVVLVATLWKCLCNIKTKGKSMFMTLWGIKWVPFPATVTVSSNKSSCGAVFWCVHSFPCWPLSSLSLLYL